MSEQIVERSYAGAAIVTEANGTLSRETIVIARGQKIEANAVLGQVTIGGGAITASAVTGTGNGTVGTLSVTNAAKIGVYTLICIATAPNGGIFSVLDPDNVVLGNATVGNAFSAGGVTFTIGDGATDYVQGDKFTVTVSPATVTATAGNTGNGTVGTVAVSTGAKVGAYRLTFVEPGSNAGDYVVEDPDGRIVASGRVGVAFNAGGLSFTVADGATDFVSGDSFTITIAAGSGEYRAYNPNGRDGTQNFAGILHERKDATNASKRAVAYVRDVEFNPNELVWADGVTDNQKAAAIAQARKRNVIARLGVGKALGEQ